MVDLLELHLNSQSQRVWPVVLQTQRYLGCQPSLPYPIKLENFIHHHGCSILIPLFISCVLWGKKTKRSWLYRTFQCLLDHTSPFNEQKVIDRLSYSEGAHKEIFWTELERKPSRVESLHSISIVYYFI